MVVRMTMNYNGSPWTFDHHFGLGLKFNLILITSVKSSETQTGEKSDTYFDDFLWVFVYNSA